MRFPVRFFAPILAVLTLSCSALTFAQSQSATQNSSRTGGIYIATDPLANVRYDNRYDISLAAAYGRVYAGPIQIHSANLGGLDLSGSYWFARRWAVEGSGRAYMGSSGANPNPYGIKGPFVAQYFITGGPEWLGPHNKHGALIAHVLVGGVYGDFEKDLHRANIPSNLDPVAIAGFYHNQFAPAMIFGGHIDLNRSSRWVFRITPDALLTMYDSNFNTNIHSAGRYMNWNPSISVGMEYKFAKKRN